MKKIFIIITLLNTFLFALQTNFEYKVENDEFIYKKRIMDKELLEKDFNSIIALKSYLIYNELTSSNIFIHFKIKDTAGNSYTQQFIVRQNSSGTPSMYELLPAATIDLNHFIQGKVGNDDTLKDKYFLPKMFDYTTIDKFLNYTYYHTLKFIIKDDPTVIQPRVNTYGFYVNVDALGKPTIKTSNTNPINDATQETTLDALLFSFSSGMNMSKRIPFRDELKGTSSEIINRNKLNIDKNLDIQMSPSLLSFVRQGDNFSFVFYTVDIFTGVETKNEIVVEEFYLIKAEIDFVK